MNWEQFILSLIQALMPAVNTVLIHNADSKTLTIVNASAGVATGVLNAVANPEQTPAK